MGKVYINGVLASQEDVLALRKHIAKYSVRTETNNRGDINIIADRVFVVTPLAHDVVRGMNWAAKLGVSA